MDWGFLDRFDSFLVQFVLIRRDCFVSGNEDPRIIVAVNGFASGLERLTFCKIVKTRIVHRFT